MLLPATASVCKLLLSVVLVHHGSGAISTSILCVAWPLYSKDNKPGACKDTAENLAERKLSGYPMHQCCPVKMPYCKVQPWKKTPLPLMKQELLGAAWISPD